MIRVLFRPLASLIVIGLLGGTAAAQQFPGFGSLEARLGLVYPDDAERGVSASVDAELGYIGTPLLRVVVGFNYFSADVDQRQIGAQQASGSIDGTGGRVGLRLDLLGSAAISPSVFAAVTAHDVSVDAALPEHRDLLDNVFGGFQVGGSFGGGAAYSLDDARRFRAVLEVRRVLMPNVNHWAGEIGVRIVPRGRQAHLPAIPDPWAIGAQRVATEAERARIERERIEAERARIEREREAERLRAEEQRREVEEARRRAEVGQREQLTEAQRLAAVREAEEARRRLEAAEDAARREATAREAAERETERLRAEAEAAERRAREAEERLYQSLLDLDRLIANITEIRETDRGLVVVLGQGLFGVGQHMLSPRARDEVGRIAAVLGQYPEHRISLEGHTDSTGSETLNQRLSEQRAEAVRAALIADGIEPTRVETVGYGLARPIADNATAAGRAQNRRVEMVLLGARRPVSN
jgi:outer membrane protein OmpA-like peptidoglycan-associated protein